MLVHGLAILRLEPAVCHSHGAGTMTVPGTQAPFGRTISNDGSLHPSRPVDYADGTSVLEEQLQSTDRPPW